MPTNAIQAWLDQVGVPWRVTRGELISDARAVNPARAREDRLPIHLPRAPLDGLLAPLSIRVSPLLTPELPPTMFAGQTSFGFDARDNLRRTTEEIRAALGETPIETFANALRATWVSGRASLRLMVWPVDLQPGTPSAHLDPRLQTSCAVSIQTGFLPPLEADERQALTSLARLGEIAPETDGEGSGIDGPGEEVLEFLRDPDGAPDIGGIIGLSPDRRTLMFRNRHLSIVQVRSILKIHVARLFPAKGQGSSTLYILCRPDDAGPRSKTIAVTSAPGPDDLNTLGATISRATGVPFELGADAFDC